VSTVTATLPAAIAELAGDIRNLPFEARALVASLQRPNAAVRNRRKSVRHPFLYEIAVQIRDPRDGRVERSVRVHTRDRNDTCIAFLADTVVPVGQEIVLDFTASPQTQALGRITAQVRRCRQFVEGWFECVAQVGIEARREPTTWERFSHWVGEFTGFGPDSRVQAVQQVRRRKSA
jgi:hypothetical protein